MLFRSFKTSWQPGRPISYKLRKLLSWFGASDNDIRHLVIEAIRVKELFEVTNPQPAVDTEPITYKIRQLPEQAKEFEELLMFYKHTDTPQELFNAVTYVYNRRIDMRRYQFYWTPEVEHKLSHRVIIPFKWKGEIIGYIARALVDGIKPKYYTQHEPDFVFNTDMQNPANKFVIVSEGPFDAMAIDGVAVLGSECKIGRAHV